MPFSLVEKFESCFSSRLICHGTVLLWPGGMKGEHRRKIKKGCFFVASIMKVKHQGKELIKISSKLDGLMSLVYEYLPNFSYVINLKNFNFIAGKQLMLHVAELVPRHPGRTKKQEPASTSNAATSKSGKGGKKKR